MKDELRKIYMETEPPEELPGVVEAALRRGERRARARKRAWRIAYPIAGAFAAFILVLNPATVRQKYSIPGWTKRRVMISRQQERIAPLAFLISIEAPRTSRDMPVAALLTM